MAYPHRHSLEGTEGAGPGARLAMALATGVALLAAACAVLYGIAAVFGGRPSLGSERATPLSSDIHGKR